MADDPEASHGHNPTHANNLCKPVQMLQDPRQFLGHSSFGTYNVALDEAPLQDNQQLLVAHQNLKQWM